MEKKEKIGLALSGGGMRAAVYHLGVLKYLAQQHMLGDVAHISTVSGASICMGLIYGSNQNRWPDDETFLKKVLPAVKENITKKDIQWTALFRLLFSPYYWDKKVNLLGNVMEQRWSVHGCLQDIPQYPLWTINTTCFETGKDFRISGKRMGVLSGAHVRCPKLRLSHAMAASAGFPVLIGPYKMKTAEYVWTDRSNTITVVPKDKVIHLWDGGVYDNMGLDPLFSMKGEDALTDDIDFLIVSNASGSIEHQSRTMSFSIQNLKRLLDINRNQVEQLRSMNVKDMFQKKHNGVYVKIGTKTKEILTHCHMEEADKKRIVESALNEQEVAFVKNYKTDLKRVKATDYDKLLKHGYESAACTFAYFGHMKSFSPLFY